MSRDTGPSAEGVAVGGHIGCPACVLRWHETYRYGEQRREEKTQGGNHDPWKVSVHRILLLTGKTVTIKQGLGCFEGQRDVYSLSLTRAALGLATLIL